MGRTHFREVHTDLTLSCGWDTMLEQQRWNVMGWLQLPSITLHCSGRKQWRGREGSWAWEEGRSKCMVILDLFYLSPSYVCINYLEIKLASPRKVSEGEWSPCLYLNQWVFTPILMRKSEIASWWTHGAKPQSIHHMMSIKTSPCLSGQGRNSLMDKLSLSADSLEKPGR